MEDGGEEGEEEGGPAGAPARMREARAEAGTAAAADGKSELSSSAAPFLEGTGKGRVEEEEGLLPLLDQELEEESVGWEPSLESSTMSPCKGKGGGGVSGQGDDGAWGAWASCGCVTDRGRRKKRNADAQYVALQVA